MHCNVYDVSGTQWRHAVNVDQTHYIHTVCRRHVFDFYGRNQKKTDTNFTESLLFCSTKSHKNSNGSFPPILLTEKKQTETIIEPWRAAVIPLSCRSH